MTPELKVTGRILPVSEATRRRNPGVYPVSQPQPIAQSPATTPSGEGIGGTTHIPKPKKMTRCEARYYDILKERYPGATITPQFRLRVSAWDAPVLCFYTADFLVSREHTFRDSGGFWNHRIFEVKDSRRKGHSDELTRPKMVRTFNPWISSVTLAVWDGKVWLERIIA